MSLQHGQQRACSRDGGCHASGVHRLCLCIAKVMARVSEWGFQGVLLLLCCDGCICPYVPGCAAFHRLAGSTIRLTLTLSGVALWGRLSTQSDNEGAVLRVA